MLKVLYKQAIFQPREGCAEQKTVSYVRLPGKHECPPSIDCLCQPFERKRKPYNGAWGTKWKETG